MSHVRTVTGTVHTPEGDPWPDFPIDFTVDPSATTLHATIPYDTVTATTGVDGTFSIDLEVDIAYKVGMRGAYRLNGRTTGYPPGTVFTIVVPDGDTPISLELIRADDITPPDDPTLVNAIVGLEGGTTDQVLSKVSDDDFAYAWIDLDTVSSIVDSVNGETGNVVLDADDIDDTATTHKYTSQADIDRLAGTSGTNTGDQDLSSLATDAELAAHTSDTANPHAVTKTQVGLSDVPNVDATQRANQTGTQPASTISDFDTEVSTNVDVAANTADRHTHANKPVLDATTASFTTADETKLDSIADGAEANVQADWDAVSGDAAILNKPTLGTAAAADTTDFATVAQGAEADSAVQPGDLATVATTGAYGDLTGTPTIPDALTDLDTTVTGAQLNGIKTKVDGIEAGAQVNAVDSVNGATGVVALDADDISDAGTTNKYTTAGDITKLAGIEDGADVTDAENVAAAGAVMDSGDETIAGVKTFSASPIVPTPTTDMQAATKQYVDLNAGGGGLELGGDGTAPTAAHSDHEHAEGTASIKIGTGTTSTGSYSVALGHSAAASSVGVAIGAESDAFIDSVAIGRSAASALSGVAAGRSSHAAGSRSIAIGFEAVSSVAETAVIRANDIDPQRSNGTGETRLALRSPDGTKYWLTVDNTGALSVTPA